MAKGYQLTNDDGTITIVPGVNPNEAATVSQLGGGASAISVTNDTTTNAVMFPLWVTANTGSLPVKVTSTKLFFNPSTGALSATNFLGTFNGNTFTAGTGILTIAAAKTLTASNTITLAGTDGTTMTFPVTSATIARTDAGQTFTGTNAFGVITATSLNGNTFTAGTYTLTGTAGKTLTFTNTLTLSGTDSTTMTFPTTSKTIAANDGSNRTIASQAIGDLLVATSTTAYGRLALGTSGFALHSNGTTSAWETDYALTFNYQLTTSVASGDITITLLNYLGTAPSSTTPVRVYVGTTLYTYTSATALTIFNDDFYTFNAGSTEFAAKDIDYFVYTSNNGGLCVSRFPYYTSFTQQSANPEGYLANTGGFSSENLSVIGRYNAIKASGASGNRSIGTSLIIAKPIFETRDLTYIPTLYGSGGSIGTFTATYEGVYRIRGNEVHFWNRTKCTNVGSWSNNVQFLLPTVAKNQLAEMSTGGWVAANGGNPATASRGGPNIVGNSNLVRFLTGVDTALLAWGTFVVNDHIRVRGIYNIA